MERFGVSRERLKDRCPQEPGCTALFAANGTLLYVGKAKRLRRWASRYLTALTLEIHPPVSQFSRVMDALQRGDEPFLVPHGCTLLEHTPYATAISRASFEE